jgi:hypothetical protein
MIKIAYAILIAGASINGQSNKDDVMDFKRRLSLLFLFCTMTKSGRQYT